MNKICLLLLMAVPFLFSSCSNEDPEPRSENDIYGAWVDGDGNYFYFGYPNTCYKLMPESEDMAALDYDAYYYEPGYGFLLYVDMQSQPDIYQVTKLSDGEMTWVWADNLLDEKYDGMSKSEILGQVIKEAQEGFKLDYSRTSTFSKISVDTLREILIHYGYSYVADEI